MTTKNPDTSHKQSVDQLLNHLDKLNNDNLIDIFIPSLSSSVKFKQLTVKQQSSLITGIISQQADKNAFSYNRSTNLIIKQNNVNNVDIKVSDRGPILTQMRVDTLGTEIVIEDASWDISDLKFSIDAESCSLINDVHTYELSGMSVSYTTPLLSYDASINADAESRFSQETGLDIISELFKIELSKFILNVSIQDVTDIDMKQLSTSDKIKVCDALPVKITRHIMKYIQDVKNIEQELLRLDETTFIPTDITLFST